MYLGGGFEKPATVAFVVDEATVAAAANGAQQADVGADPASNEQIAAGGFQRGFIQPTLHTVV
jgi:hypothetical protein